ncbi:MAG TPA: type I-C CRISPR-associated protein Cas5c [Nitrosomonas sp.]|nr:type I-C CRISPR-associated protein Cas5c [Nitrosomonas sp.]HQX13609.1 type I-C CRISPR-associated protein Cas5c [Nitrosomonas sp.]HRB32996.1 type I-C CRISPR-associated protein Cas5c [Nitrosomonas sp.]HRB45657.1 type I-C CRISPR-associated protein Cas5c [Nitrosomonas sp.]HRB77662.1 type I-C CRISPR-associated protein Cas5c [Nitrosomonas sp.]
MKTYCLEVSGDFACFTRPEMKVERVSYDVMTPSSARAVFESILWKPAIRWHIDKIEVLKPIHWVSVRRNEVGAIVSVRNAQEAMNKGTGYLGLNIEDERQQRAGLFLRDVAYRIHAHFELQPSAGENNMPAKFLDMFERRAEKGQCVNQPYLGCREFACDFRLVDPAQVQSNPVAETRDLGWMLYDMDYRNAADPQPRFFRAALENGILNVPTWDSQEVRG